MYLQLSFIIFVFQAKEDIMVDTLLFCGTKKRESLPIKFNVRWWVVCTRNINKMTRRKWEQKKRKLKMKVFFLVSTIRGLFWWWILEASSKVWLLNNLVARNIKLLQIKQFS